MAMNDIYKDLMEILMAYNIPVLEKHIFSKYYKGQLIDIPNATWLQDYLYQKYNATISMEDAERLEMLFITYNYLNSNKAVAWKNNGSKRVNYLLDDFLNCSKSP